MGLIKAGIGAAGGVLADSWREYFYCDSLEADVLCAVDLMHRGLAQPREDVMWEFRRLFVGPGALVVPPWGSTYLDRDGVVFGDSHTQLVAFMRANGIIRLADEHHPCDHIGLMLHLMAWMPATAPPSFASMWRNTCSRGRLTILMSCKGVRRAGFTKGLRC